MDDDDNASVVFSWSDNDDELKDEISALEQAIDTQIPPKAVPEIVNEDPNQWRTPAPPRPRIRKWDVRTAPTTSGTPRIDSGSNTEQSGAARRGDVRSDIEKFGGPTKSRDLRSDIRTSENTPSAGRDLREEIQVMTKTFGDQALGELPSSASSRSHTQPSIPPVSIKLVAVRRGSDTYRPSSRRRSYSRRNTRSRSRSRSNSRGRYRSRSRGKYRSRSRRRTRSRSRGRDRDWDRNWDRGKRRSRSRSRSRSRGRRLDRNRKRSTSRSRTWAKDISRSSSSSQSKSSSTTVSASAAAKQAAAPAPLTASAVKMAPAAGAAGVAAVAGAGAVGAGGAGAAAAVEAVAGVAGTSTPNPGVPSVGGQGLVSRPALPTPPAFATGVAGGINDATAPSSSPLPPATPPSALPSSAATTTTLTPPSSAPATSTTLCITTPSGILASHLVSQSQYSSSPTAEEQHALVLAGSQKQTSTFQTGLSTVAPDSTGSSSAPTQSSLVSEQQQGDWHSAPMATDQPMEEQGKPGAPPPTTGTDANESNHPARYFLMRCGSESEIEDARTTNTWPTNPVYDKTLRQAYDPWTPVYFIFTVRLAREFYGIAKMASEIGWLEERSIFDRSKFRQKMQLQWISYARVSYEAITEKLHKPGYTVITRNGQELGKDIGSYIHKFLESQRDQASVSKNVASDSSMDIDQEQVSDESHMQVDQDEEAQAETRAKTKEDYLAEVREEDLREARQGQALAQAQAQARSELLAKTREQPKEQPQIQKSKNSSSDMDIDSGEDEDAADDKERASRASDSSLMDLDSPGEATTIILPQEQPSVNLFIAQILTSQPSTSARRELIQGDKPSRGESSYTSETRAPEEVSVKRDSADEVARGRPVVRSPLPQGSHHRAGPSHPSPTLPSPTVPSPTLPSPTLPTPRIVSGQRPPVFPPAPRIKDDRSYAANIRPSERPGPKSRRPPPPSRGAASVRYHSPPPPVSKPRYRSPPPRRNPTPPPPRSRNHTPPPRRPRSLHDRPSTWTDYSYSRPPLSPPLPPLQYETPGTTRYSPARRRTPIRAPADPRLARSQSAGGSNSTRPVDSGPNTRQPSPSVIPEKRPYPREPLPMSMPALSAGVDPYASLGHDGSSDEGGGGFSPLHQSQAGEGSTSSQPAAKITLVPAGLSKTQRKKQRKLALQKSARLPSPSLP